MGLARISINFNNEDDISKLIVTIWGRKGSLLILPYEEVFTYVSEYDDLSNDNNRQSYLIKSKDYNSISDFIYKIKTDILHIISLSKGDLDKTNKLVNVLDELFY